MSEDEDLSAWGDALAEQADAEETEGDSAEDPWGDALSEQADAEANVDADSDEINSAAFDQLTSERGDGKNKVDLDVLLDIPVTLQLEIGRTKVSIRNLLKQRDVT